mmetsp:Transcript_11817/g.20124  ORF Transcript_11817/g.20124 Transcript_11817/m.20124 type:complete len:407 (-) Transcript_11817:444-1664(-)
MHAQKALQSMTPYAFTLNLPHTTLQLSCVRQHPFFTLIRTCSARKFASSNHQRSHLSANQFKAEKEDQSFSPSSKSRRRPTTTFVPQTVSGVTTSQEQESFESEDAEEEETSLIEQRKRMWKPAPNIQDWLAPATFDDVPTIEDEEEEEEVDPLPLKRKVVRQVMQNKKSEVGTEERELRDMYTQTGGMQWYMLFCTRDREREVKAGLEKDLQRKVNSEYREQIGRIEIPKPAYEITYNTKGEKKVNARKRYPARLLLLMRMNRNTFRFCLERPHCFNFLGKDVNYSLWQRKGRQAPRSIPTPLSREEVEGILRPPIEEARPPSSSDAPAGPIRTQHVSAGDSIKVIAGPLKGFQGEAVTVADERRTVKALLLVFGRPTEAEINFDDMEVVAGGGSRSRDGPDIDD